MKTIGVDLGSNTLRAVFLDDDNQILWKYETIVRTAEGLSKHLLITSSVLQRLITAIEEMRIDFKNQIGKDFFEFPYLALATAALRKAQNQQDIIHFILQKQGFLIKVISPQEEALFTLNATLFALKQYKQDIKTFFLVDIGGASIEVSFYQYNGAYLDPFSKHSIDIFQTQSFDIGIITLSEYGSQIKIIQAMIDKMKEEIKIWKNQCLKFTHTEPLLIMSGGVPSTVVAIKQRLNYEEFLQIRQGIHLLNIHNMESEKKFYRNLSHQEKIKFVGEKRIDLIEIGMLLYRIFFDIFEVHDSVVVSESLREGAALYAKQLFN